MGAHAVNLALVGELNALELVGLDSAKLAQLRGWGKDRSVTLQLKTVDRCEFEKKTTREEDSASKLVYGRVMRCGSWSDVL